VERLAQRRETLAKLEQDKDLSRAPMQSQTQLSDADVTEGAERIRRQKEDAELDRRWPEMRAESEAALKENFRAVREQAERAQQAVDAQVRDLDERFAQERQGLADTQARDMAVQVDPAGAKQLQERLDGERRALEANYQQQRS